MDERAPTDTVPLVFSFVTVEAKPLLRMRRLQKRISEGGGQHGMQQSI